MAKKPSRIISRTGFSNQKANMKAGEYGYYTDTRTPIVGDETDTPGRIPTTKATGDFDLSSINKVIFNNLEIEGTLNGVDITDIIDKVDSSYTGDTNVLYGQLPYGASIVVRSATIADPPSSPNAKDVYLVPSNATGAWLGKTNSLAQKSGTEWKFTTPTVRTIVGVADNGSTLLYTNTGWISYYPSNDEHKAHLVSDRPATPAGVYDMIQTFAVGGGSGGSSGKYTASDIPPANPSLRDQWWDTVSETLYTWGSNGNSYSWIAISRRNNTGSTTVGNTNSDYVLPLTWNYGIENFSFETWTDDSRYSWRDFDKAVITSAVAGDDTIDLVSTAGIQANQTYALADKNGVFLQSVDVISVLTANRIRVRNDLSVTLASSDNAVLTRTTFTVGSRYATVKNNDVLFTKLINSLASTAKGFLVLRRSGTGMGIFNIKYRTKGTLTWTDLELNKVLNVGEQSQYRDEYYDIPAGGNIQFWYSYTGGTATPETIYHMTLFPKSQAVDANRIVTPTNVSPSDQAVSVSTTPTLTGSLYRSIYGLQQNGAEFQIAVDKKFSNIVVSSSTDFLASWIRVTGASANSKAVQFLSNRKAVVVGDAGSVRITTDGGNTYNTGTLATSVDLKSISYNGSRTVVVGASGSIQFSDNDGSSFTNSSVTDSFAGTLNGVVSLPGDIVVAVGTSGEILRSTNGAVIFTKILPDNSFTGTFNSICSDASGNIIAVGANGEIQTSSNRGQSFIHRSPAVAYSGAFYSVDMDDSGNAIAVGANGEIQISSDYGASWTHISADATYTGNFFGVYIYGDYGIIVGTSGEIQSSKNKGRTWTHRVAANAESGTFRAVALTPDNYALVVGDGGITQIPLRLTASTSYTVPTGTDLLQGNKVYYWRHRYQDAAGFWSDYSVPTIFATTQATLNAVKQPTNLSPASAATVDILPTLQSSAFGTTGAADTHSKSQWQVATDSVFSTIVYDSGDSNSLLSITLTTPLTNNKQYYWRVRHKGTTAGYSPYSQATFFNAIARPVTPTITLPASGATVSIAAPITVKTSNFASSLSGDTLVNTVAYLYRSISDIGNSSNALTASSATTTVSLPRADNVNPAYSVGQTYYLVVQQIGSLSGPSSLSSPTPITFRAAAPIGEYVSLGLGYGGDPAGNPRFQELKFTVPNNVYSVCAVAVGPGGGSLVFLTNAYNAGSYYQDFYGVRGGCGGGLTWKNDIPVTPGQVLTIRLGYAGGGGNVTDNDNMWGRFELNKAGSGQAYTYVGASTGDITFANGGTTAIVGIMSATGGGWVFNPDAILPLVGKGGIAMGGDGGGNGGEGTLDIKYHYAFLSSSQPGGAEVQGGAGGGAGGYNGNGGIGASGPRSAAKNSLLGGNGAGGAASGGGVSYPGGGVGIRGIGASGVGIAGEGQGGSGGTTSNGPAVNGNYQLFNSSSEKDNYYSCGGKFGGGAGLQCDPVQKIAIGGRSAVRIIWGDGRSFPDNAA